ncbi:hypothetical protein E2562_033266 [Oryza meyeriana var. granulata]|uniref:Uncharacterized protein n=1 Tax=Oryza meyeriana var. granulata TaxID=110450 RepID=A0A6G1CVV0_9ORYZ|nr:hypothetical protein E2562_033266 [Oryza meyeriana var. granulata]
MMDWGQCRPSGKENARKVKMIHSLATGGLIILASLPLRGLKPIITVSLIVPVKSCRQLSLHRRAAHPRHPFTGASLENKPVAFIF